MSLTARGGFVIRGWYYICSFLILQHFFPLNFIPSPGVLWRRLHMRFRDGTHCLIIAFPKKVTDIKHKKWVYQTCVIQINVNHATCAETTETFLRWIPLNVYLVFGFNNDENHRSAESCFSPMLSPHMILMFHVRQFCHIFVQYFIHYSHQDSSLFKE